jgi:hypothetical protein
MIGSLLKMNRKGWERKRSWPNTIILDNDKWPVCRELNPGPLDYGVGVLPSGRRRPLVAAVRQRALVEPASHSRHRSVLLDINYIFELPVLPVTNPSVQLHSVSVRFDTVSPFEWTFCYIFYFSLL